MITIKNPFSFLAGKITEGSRVATVKLKINGRCVNKCRFCPFHNDPHLLEAKDIANFFRLAGKRPIGSIVINGGEPTIHPRFRDICAYLKEQHRHDKLLSLGTNLIPFTWARGRYIGLQKTVFEVFHRIEVGCDDEHRNIDVLERFAPEIVAAGITLDVNVMPEYCSTKTKERILAVRDRCGIKVTFSELHHYYKSRPVINNTSRRCRKRLQNLLINCNGDAFFCFHQEFERPLFNLFTAGSEEISYFLGRYDPPPYLFCACCPRFVAESLFPIRILKIAARGIKRYLLPV